MDFKKIFRENPVLVGVAGLCPAVAVTTTVMNSLVLGLGTILVLLGAGLASRLLGKWIPARFATWFHILVAAGLTTLVQLLTDAFLPKVSKSLGVFIGLIAVNCIVIDGGAFARTHRLSTSLGTLLGMGLGFLFVLLILGGIREIGGNGTFLGVQLLQNGPAPNSLLMVVPGGLLLLSILTAFSQWLRNRAARRGKGVLHP